MSWKFIDNRREFIFITASHNPLLKTDEDNIVVPEIQTRSGSLHYNDVKVGMKVYISESDYPDRVITAVSPESITLSALRTVVTDVLVGGSSIRSPTTININADKVVLTNGWKTINIDIELDAATKTFDSIVINGTTYKKI